MRPDNSKEELEKAILVKQLESLNQSFWSKPEAISTLTPIVIALGTIGLGIYTGYFDRINLEIKKENLEHDIKFFEAKKDSLSKSNSYLVIKNQKLLDENEKLISASNSLVKSNNNLEKINSVLFRNNAINEENNKTLANQNNQLSSTNQELNKQNSGLVVDNKIKGAVALIQSIKKDVSKLSNDREEASQLAAMIYRESSKLEPPVTRDLIVAELGNEKINPALAVLFYEILISGEFTKDWKQKLVAAYPVLLNRAGADATKTIQLALAKYSVGEFGYWDYATKRSLQNSTFNFLLTNGSINDDLRLDALLYIDKNREAETLIDYSKKNPTGFLNLLKVMRYLLNKGTLASSRYIQLGRIFKEYAPASYTMYYGNIISNLPDSQNYIDPMSKYTYLFQNGELSYENDAVANRLAAPKFVRISGNVSYDERTRLIKEWKKWLKRDLFISNIMSNEFFSVIEKDPSKISFLVDNGRL